jgi:hypothetical protein
MSVLTDAEMRTYIGLHHRIQDSIGSADDG